MSGAWSVNVTSPSATTSMVPSLHCLDDKATAIVSTVPDPPSTRTTSPLTSRFVPILVFTMQGIPSSRATIAP